MGAGRFEDLEVWQKAHRWVLQVYKVTRAFPKEELFVLTAQLRERRYRCPPISAKGSERDPRRTKYIPITQRKIHWRKRAINLSWLATYPTAIASRFWHSWTKLRECWTHTYVLSSVMPDRTYSEF
jgi:hypothetical protein